MAQMAPPASLDWPQREPCNNLSDQNTATSSQANILLDSIARATGWGSIVQINRASIVNFIANVQRLCEMVPDSDSAGLHAGTNLPNQPAEPHSSSQQDLVRTLAEIKSLKEVMDRKVAAVEAAIGPANESLATGPTNLSGKSTDTGMDDPQDTAQKHLHKPVFGAPAWSEGAKTHSTNATQMLGLLPRDTPVFGSFPSSKNSATELSSGVQASRETAKVDAGTVMSIRALENAAGTPMDAASEVTQICPEASGSGATDPHVTETNRNTGGRQAVAPQSGSPSSPKPIDGQSLMPDRLMPTGDSLIESNSHPSAGQTAADSVSGSHSGSRSITGQTAAALSSNSRASRSTEREEPDSKRYLTTNQIALDSTFRASDSASAAPLPPEDNGGPDDQDSNENGSDEESSDGENGTEYEDSVDENSSSNENTEMEDTEISEQSDESDATKPKPIEAWRKGITKPVSIGVPKSVRAFSPSTTIPAPPIKKRSLWLRIRISIPDRRIKSELKHLSQPELKCRIEREVVTTKSRIQHCKVMPSGDIRLFTTDRRGNKALQKPKNWRPGAFGKGASVLAYDPERYLLLP